VTPILWTESARADLRAIRDYVSRDSEVYAKRLIDRIRASVERLRRFPKSGARVPDWAREQLREVLAGNYRVIYRFTGNAVEVIAVIHAARQLPDLASE
jgi:toxin ParE1/3/4